MPLLPIGCADRFRRVSYVASGSGSGFGFHLHLTDKEATMLCDFMVVLFAAAVVVKFQKERAELIARKSAPQVTPVSTSFTYKDSKGKTHREYYQ